MSATITTKLVDNSKEWADALKKRFVDAGGSADDFEKHLEALNKELESRAAKQAAEDIKKLADEIEKTTDATRKNTDELKKNNKGWTELQAKFNLMKEGFSWVKTGFSAISNLSQQAAADGNASFQKLISSGNEFNKTLRQWHQSRFLSDLAHDLSDPNSGATSALKTLGTTADWTFTKMREGTQQATRGWMIMGETVGLVSEGTVKAYDQIGAARERDSQARAKANAKAMADYQKEMAAVQKIRNLDMINPGLVMRQDQAVSEWIEKLEDAEDVQKEINNLVETQTKLHAKLTAKGKDPSQDRTFLENQRDLIALENKRFELVKAHKEWEKEEDMKRAQRQLAEVEKRLAWEREVAQAAIDGEQAKFMAREARLAAEEQADQAKADKLKGFMQQGSGGPNDVMGRLQGSIKPGDVQKRVSKNREDEALAAWREEQRASGKMDQNNQLIGYGGESSKLMAGRTRVQEEAIRKQTRMGAYRDARKGNVSNEEMAAAQGQLLQEAGEKMISDNKFSKTATTAIKQTISGVQQLKEEQGQLADEVRGMTQRLDVMFGRGNNNQQRAQRQF